MEIIIHLAGTARQMSSITLEMKPIELLTSKAIPWTFAGFGCYSGSENMHFDGRLLKELREGALTSPILRLYTWQNPTVSLGKNQMAQ